MILKGCLLGHLGFLLYGVPKIVIFGMHVSAVIFPRGVLLLPQTFSQDCFLSMQLLVCSLSTWPHVCV